MMDCQYVATQRGGVALVFEGHRYNKVRDGKDGTVYWRCSRDRQCPGRAVTVHSRIKKANNKHNHCPDNGVKSGQTLISSSQIGQLSQLGAAVGQNAMAQSLQGLNCNANSVAAMAAILGQGNNATAAAVAALLQQQHSNSGNKNCHSNGISNNSLIALSNSNNAHATLSQHSSSSASSSPFQLDSSENGVTFNFPSLKQLNGSPVNNAAAVAAAFSANNNGQANLSNSPLDMLGLNNGQNDFSVLQQLQNNLQNTHRSQSIINSTSSVHRSSLNNTSHVHGNNLNAKNHSRENSRDNSNNSSCNNSNNSSLSTSLGSKTLNGIGKNFLLDAQSNAHSQLINELKLNSLMSLNSLVKNAVANQGNCNLNNNLAVNGNLNSNNNSISNYNGNNGKNSNNLEDSISLKNNFLNNQNGNNNVLNNNTAAQLNNLLMQMDQMNQLANSPNSNNSPTPVLNGDTSNSKNDNSTMQTLNQLNNLLNNNLTNKLQHMLALPSLVNETLKYFSSTNNGMAAALANQMAGQFASSSNNAQNDDQMDCIQEESNHKLMATG